MSSQDDVSQRNGGVADDLSDSTYVFPGITYRDLLEKDLVDLMGAPDMKQEDKDALHAKMMETIQSRVLYRLVNALTEEEFGRFKTALQEKNNDVIYEITASKNIDLAVIYAEETLLYKLQMVDLIQQSKEMKED